MFLAIALNQKIRLIRFYRLAVFIPVAVSTIATGVMFLWVFDATFGIANWALGQVGLGPFGWFNSPQGAMPSLVIMTVWGWLGFDAIIYLAALQGVPHELVEAAAVDGATRWSTFRNVTLPLLGTGHAAAGRVVDDQRGAAVRRGVLRDEGRSARAHERAGLLHLQAGVHELVRVQRGRVRGGARLRACSS